MLNITINKKLIYVIPIFIAVVFQTFLFDNLKLDFFRITDEIMVLMSVMLLVVIAFQTKRIDKYVLYFVTLFLILLTISMLLENISLEQNIFGFLDIYKYAVFFLFFPYIFKYLNITKSHISSVVEFTLYAFLIFAILFYLFPTSFLNAHQEHQRMGIYRLGTFVSDVNTFALVLYMLFFAIYLNIVKIKNRKFWLYVIVVMLFLTFSRSTMFVFLFSFLILNIKNYRLLIKFIPILLLFILFVALFDKNQSNAAGTFTWVPSSHLKTENLEFGESEYRTMVYYKSILMFLDSPFVGYGLGTFGTPTSLKLNNQLYVDYGFPQTEFVEGGFNVQDVYYPIIYVQTGIVGLFIFFIFWYELLVNRFKYETNSFLFARTMYFGLLILSINSMTFMVGSFMFFYALIISIDMVSKKTEIQNCEGKK